MSRRDNDGSMHYQNHQRVTELEDGAAHAYRAAEQQHGKQDHLTGSELSRNEHEHPGAAHGHGQLPSTGHGAIAFGHAETAALAYKFWEARGGAEGSPEEDWFRAVKELRSRRMVD